MQKWFLQYPEIDYNNYIVAPRAAWRGQKLVQFIRNVSAMYPQCIQPRIGRTNRYCYLPVRAKGYGAEMNRRK